MRQGLVSYAGTFCTIIICSLTGLVVVSSVIASQGAIDIADRGNIITQACFEQIPYCGKYVLAFAIFAFASTTLFGWFYYGEQCIHFLCAKRWLLLSYKGVYVLFSLLGALGSLSVVWDFSNFANGLMVIPNVISVLLLHKVVEEDTRRFLWSDRLSRSDPGCMQ